MSLDIPRTPVPTPKSHNLTPAIEQRLAALETDRKHWNARLTDLEAKDAEPHERLTQIERSFASIMESLNVMDGVCDDRTKQHERLEALEKAFKSQQACLNDICGEQRKQRAINETLK